MFSALAMPLWRLRVVDTEWHIFLIQIILNEIIMLVVLIHLILLDVVHLFEIHIQRLSSKWFLSLLAHLRSQLRSWLGVNHNFLNLEKRSSLSVRICSSSSLIWSFSSLEWFNWFLKWLRNSTFVIDGIKVQINILLSHYTDSNLNLFIGHVRMRVSAISKMFIKLRRPNMLLPSSIVILYINSFLITVISKRHLCRLVVRIYHWYCRFVAWLMFQINSHIWLLQINIFVNSWWREVLRLFILFQFLLRQCWAKTSSWMLRWAIVLTWHRA